MRPKHVPQRTCVACRRKGPKAGFVRIVRSAGGEYVVDPPRTTPGRGAYLCRDYSCWETGLERGALARALKGQPDGAARRELADWAHREFRPGVEAG